MKVTKVKSVIQLYAGDTSNGFPIWIDSMWGNLKDARKAYPEIVYRSIATKSFAPTSKQSFQGTPESCQLEGYGGDGGDL